MPEKKLRLFRHGHTQTPRARISVLFLWAFAAGCSDPLSAPQPSASATATAPEAATPGAANMAGPGPSTDRAAPDMNPRPDSAAMSPGIGPNGRIVSECQGFALAGLKYSPGGSVLPNTCAPFDSSTNNPYAVRCVDAIPAYQTPYAGDEYCILPPPPELGVQVGVHPQTDKYWDEIWAGNFAGYRDASLTQSYELPPGSEALQEYHTTFTVPEARHFYRINFRGRYGSHHSVGRFVGSPPAEREGWAGADDSFNLRGEPLANLQRANADIPLTSLEIPEEEQGIGFSVPADTSLSFDLHHFNSSDRAILREIWLNVWWMPQSAVTRPGVENFGFAAVNYPPGQVTDAGASLLATGETQLLSLFGHRHAWTTRFSAWLIRAGSSDEELIYDSHDWLDVPSYAYNSLTQNPAPSADPLQRSDGAVSGKIVLNAGDRLRFNCHAEVTQEQADALGRPLPSAPLTFANQAFSGEMCVLGAVATGRLSSN